MRGKKVMTACFNNKIYIFILALLVLIPIGSAQTCGNTFCEFNSATLSSGANATIAGHTVLMNYVGQGSITLSVDGSTAYTFSLGTMGTINNIPIRIADIDDTNRKAEISIGENTLSCNQDCFGTHELLIAPLQQESYSNPDIDCNSATKTCAVAFEDVPNDRTKASYFNSSQIYALSSQTVSSSGENYEPRVVVGNNNAFVEWIQKIPASPDKYNILGSLITAVTKSSSPLEISNQLYPNPKSLHGPPVYVSSNFNYVSYWVEARFTGTGKDVLGAFIHEGSTPPKNGVGDDGAFYYDNPIPASNPSNSKDPYVIYSDSLDRMVMVWSEEDYLGVSDMMMQFIESNGPVVPGSLFKFNKTFFLNDPVPILGKSGKRIVFFEDNNITSTTNIFAYVQNQIISSLSHLPFRLPINPSIITLSQFASVLNFNIQMEDVAYNPVSDEYVVLWTRNFLGSSETILQAFDTSSGLPVTGKQKRFAGYNEPSIAYTGLQNAPYVLAYKKGSLSNSRIMLTFFDNNLNPNPKISTPLIVPAGTQRKYTASKDTVTKVFNVTRTSLTSVVTAGITCAFNPSSCTAVSFTNLNDGDNVPITDDVLLTFTDDQNRPRLLMLANFNDTHSDTGNFSTLKIESNENATVIDHTGIQWQVQKLYLGVPNNNNGAYVLVCPDATTLSEVVPGCTGVVEFSNVNNTVQTKTSGSLSVTAQLNDDNTSYFLGGLDGSGATTSQSQTTTTLTVTAESGKGVGEQVRFTASYYQNSVCTVWFTAPPTQSKFNMTVSSSNSMLYEYSTNFTDIGTYDANFECSNVLGNASKSKSFSIGATSSNEPTVTLNSPSNNAVLSTSSVTFKCSAQAVSPNRITSIDLFIDGTFKDTNTTLNSSATNATFTQSVSAGPHTYNCRATDSASNRALSALNSTFTVNTGTTLRACTSNDWTCAWTPSDSSCQQGSTQTYKCNPPTTGTCSNPDPVKPAETTRQCAASLPPCTDSDYGNTTWSVCGSSGNQTGTRRIRDTSVNTCAGDTIRTETRSCSPGGDNTLLIIIVVVIIAAAAGGAFFYLHKKGTNPPKDEEETLWDEEYDKSEKGGEDEYSDEDYEEDEGK